MRRENWTSATRSWPKASVNCGGEGARPTLSRGSELQAFKQDWDRRSTLPKNDLPKLASASELEPGKAAAQTFVGEDPSAPRRKLRQHAQMRTWSLEQMALKEAHKNDGKEEDRRFAAWESHVSQQRAQVEGGRKTSQGRSATGSASGARPPSRRPKTARMGRRGPGRGMQRARDGAHAQRPHVE